MRESGLFTVDGHSWPAPIGSTIELTERGLVYAGGSVLVRMRKSADGRPDLAIGADRERMLALLSIAIGAPVVDGSVMPHVETAAEHWRHGERALANLRLVFAGLGSPSDPAAGHRVALAACLLDQGWPPAALLEELGLAAGSDDLGKYNHNHVPAGYGERSGEFDFRSGAAPATDGRIVVAEDDRENEYQVRDLLGETNLKEDEEHHHLIPTTPIPVMGGAVIGSNTQQTLSAAARAAATKLGPGKGHVYGTTVHTEYREQVEALGRYDLHGEQSYKNRRWVCYGTPGSVRCDTVQGSKYQPDDVYDLKTGAAGLNPSRIKQLQSHLPLRKDGTEVPIHEVRP